MVAGRGRLAALKNLVWLVLVVAACGGDGDDARECAASSECLQGNIPGECLVSSASDKKFCAYPDGTCTSGDRWGVAAGDGLAGECVAADGVDGGVDAGSVDAGGVDAAPPTLGNWSEPALLQNVNTVEYDEWSPSISKNGLELYFVSDRSAQHRVYVARRASTDEPFGTPMELPAGSIPTSPDRTELSESGLELYFQTGETGISNIYVSTRATPSAVWSAPVHVDLQGDIVYLPDMAISGDGLAMYLILANCQTEPCIRRVTRGEIGGDWSPVLDEPLDGFEGLDYRTVDVSPDEFGVVLCDPRENGLADAIESARPSKGVTFSDFEVITGFENVSDCVFNTDRSELYLTVGSGNERDLAVSLRD